MDDNDSFKTWFTFSERQRNYWSLQEEKAQFRKEAKEKRDREKKQRALIRRAKPKPPPKRRKKHRCLFQSFGSHCPKGHEYTEENTYRVTGSKGPQRQCRTCAMARMRKYWHSRAAKVKAQVKAEQEARRDWLKSRPPMEGVSDAMRITHP